MKQNASCLLRESVHTAKPTTQIYILCCRRIRPFGYFFQFLLLSNPTICRLVRRTRRRCRPLILGKWGTLSKQDQNHMNKGNFIFVKTGSNVWNASPINMSYLTLTCFLKKRPQAWKGTSSSRQHQKYGLSRPSPSHTYIYIYRPLTPLPTIHRLPCT